MRSILRAAVLAWIVIGCLPGSGAQAQSCCPRAGDSPDIRCSLVIVVCPNQSYEILRKPPAPITSPRPRQPTHQRHHFHRPFWYPQCWDWDASRASEMAFGNADAQYCLGRMYLDGVQPDLRQAARWFALAANKGQFEAQAALGHMLLKGDAVEACRRLDNLLRGRHAASALGSVLGGFGGACSVAAVPRRPAEGLMWLTLAHDVAKTDYKWISELYDAAFKQATYEERAQALVYLERWKKSRHD
jgi:hypothetical protein